MARACSWRAEPTRSRELTASTKEKSEFRMKRKEKTEMQRKDKDDDDDGEEDGFGLEVGWVWIDVRGEEGREIWDGFGVAKVKASHAPMNMKPRPPTARVKNPISFLVSLSSLRRF